MGKSTPKAVIRQRVTDVRHVIETQGLSIAGACTALGIGYWVFLRHLTDDEQLELRNLWLRHRKPNNRTSATIVRVPRRKYKDVVIDDPKPTPTTPLAPVPIRTGPSPEAIRKQNAEDIATVSKALEVPAPYVRTIDAPETTDPFGFPKIIYRMHKNFVGTWSCVKLSFFIRVEADVYFVVGYQYELSEFPGVFRADANLYDFNTDVNVALANLRRVIDDKVGPELDDKILGKIQYGMQYVAPYDPRQIVAKTKIGAPDGEYMARVSRDLGRLEAGGKLYEFVIPENLPSGVLRCEVKGNQVTLFV